MSELEQTNRCVDSVLVSDFKHDWRVTFIDPRFDKQTELGAKRRDHVAPDGAFNSGAHLGYKQSAPAAVKAKSN